MPDLKTLLKQRLKLHIYSNITSEDIIKYDIDLDEDDLKKLSLQIMSYYGKEFKFIVYECNSHLENALSDVPNFFNVYSHLIIYCIERYITLNNGFKEFLNISIFGGVLFENKDKYTELHIKTNSMFCDMIDKYIFQIYSIVTNTLIHQNQNPDENENILTYEEFNDYANLPTFCVMVRDQLIS